MKRVSLLLTMLVTFACTAVQAQFTQSQLVDEFTRAKAYTKAYLDAMPEDGYALKPTPIMRTFAQQMLHLAAANVMLMTNVTTDKIPAGISFTLEQRASAQTKDSVVYYVTTSYDFARNAVANSDVSKWWDVKKIFNRFDETVFAMMNKTFEHQTHHRGQTTIYIRLVGIKPPNERLF